MTIAPAPAPLLYADPLPGWGVSYSAEPDQVLVVMPVAARWRDLSRGWRLGFGWCLFMFMFTIVAAVANGFNEPGVNFNVSFYGLIAALMVAAFIYWKHLRIIVEINPRWVVVATSFGGKAKTRVRWPRSLVRQIKRNLSNGKLLVYIDGSDFKEIEASPHREVTEWVAAKLDNALRTVPTAALAPGEVVPEPDTTASAGPLGRRILAVIGVIGLGLSIFLAIYLGNPCPIMGGLFIAAATFGIGFGTQEKEYYM